MFEWFVKNNTEILLQLLEHNSDCINQGKNKGKRPRVQPSRRWQDDMAKKEETTRNRTAIDRRQWRAFMDGYILKWIAKA